MISRLKAAITLKRMVLLFAIAIALVALLFLLKHQGSKWGVFAVLGAGLLVAISVWTFRRISILKASRALLALISGSTPGIDAQASQTLRENMQSALTSIKSSRLGRRRGSAALYELPWYMVIGNPSAGKSTAILNSGLHFPFNEQDAAMVESAGGTRDCDWYLTSEGILLDTAGRYSVRDDDRSEWLSFLRLLRKHRPRAPINGIIIAASISELIGNKPDFAIELGKKLRLRIQELTDNLEVIAPVYVVFTKADLIHGFTDFFQGMDPAERQKVWGATFAFQPEGNNDTIAQFETYFDELCDGLREMSIAQMAVSRDKQHAPAMLSLPLEFKQLKASLRTFLVTLFEENPYQHRPVVRGFYFSSAAQKSMPVHTASEVVARTFDLSEGDSKVAEQSPTWNSYFLLDLFRRVIFADRELVKQYSSARRTRQRAAMLLCTALFLGAGLAGWATSYTNNRQLVSNVEADLKKAVLIQQDRIDLQARLEALEVLQDRLEQLQVYKKKHPLMLGLGLYQGDIVEQKLRREYFKGMSQLMLRPAVHQLESYLVEVARNAGQLRLQPAGDPKTPSRNTGVYQSASPTDVQQGYNALKAYLMLGDVRRVEPSHLGDQLTRFWRHWLEANRGVMEREVMVVRAERLMSFYISQSGVEDWPVVENKVTLIEDTRRALGNVMQGMPARDRVYAEIKARAATRFPSISVASIFNENTDKIFAGSYAISGAFSRQAWEGYVKHAIRDAANKELKTTDWVLQTTRSDDLTLSGSPEHIQKELEQIYAQEYIAQWRKFLQGITVTGFGGFRQATLAMNQLGDPQNSPMRKLLETVYLQTSWDNASAGSVAPAGDKWWKSLFSSSSSQEKLSQGVPNADGPVGREFSGIARMMASSDGKPSLLQSYLEVLSRIRTRLNAIHTQGNPGPGARELVLQTLDASGGSELSAGLTLVDEQLLSSMDDSQRRVLRPILLWPMVQTFGAMIPATQNELNQIWKHQIHQPFQQSLAGKYPFAAGGQIEATSAEVAEIFGPQGAISKFASESLGPLVIRRGNILASKQWADIGISLTPTLLTGFAQWVAPLGEFAEGGAVSIFQILPGSAIGFSEYTIVIGDQQLRYRNTPAQWSNFAWDSSKSNQTAKVSIVTYDGRVQEVESYTGHNALGQLIQSATSRQNSDGSYELQWGKGEWSVPVTMKIISNPGANADGSQRQGLMGTQLPVHVVGAQEFTEETL